MERPESGNRFSGKECAGACKHSSTYHQAKWFDKLSNDYKYGCCSVDCPCMQYVAPKEETITEELYIKQEDTE